MQRFLRCFCVPIAALLVSHGAWAADPQPSADTLFRDGRTAFDAGDFATACAKFRESLALEHTTGTLFNLALCEDRRGEVASAWRHYQEAAGRMKADDPRRTIAENRTRAMVARLPHVTLRVKDPKLPGLRITWDGEAVEARTWGTPQVVNPGKHGVHVTAEGHEARDYEVTLDEADTKEVDVAPGPRKPLLPVPIPGPTVETPARRAERIAGLSLVGVGGVGLATSFVSGLMVLQEKAVFDRVCPEQACDQEAARASAARGNTWGLAANVTFGVGVVGTVFGVVLLAVPGAPTHRGASVWRPESPLTLRW